MTIAIPPAQPTADHAPPRRFAGRQTSAAVAVYKNMNAPITPAGTGRPPAPRRAAMNRVKSMITAYVTVPGRYPSILGLVATKLLMLTV